MFKHLKYTALGVLLMAAGATVSIAVLIPFTWLIVCHPAALTVILTLLAGWLIGLALNSEAFKTGGK